MSEQKHTSSSSPDAKSSAAATLELPTRISKWTATDVSNWLARVNFEEARQAFALQKVNGALLLTLTEQDLVKEFTVSPARGSVQPH